jgi:hypothetical protein
LFLLLIGTCGFAFAAKQFVMPTPRAAQSYTAHDSHTKEFVTVGANVYDRTQEATIFSAHYNDESFVPIFIVITNDGDQSVSLVNLKAEYITADRGKVSRATEDDIYRRLSHPGATPNASPLPWPKKVKGGVSQQIRDEIDRSQFAAKAIEPHTTQAGFMFFDVSELQNPVAGATLYLTGINDAKGNELMYFEVPLQK